MLFGPYGAYGSDDEVGGLAVQAVDGTKVVVQRVAEQELRRRGTREGYWSGWRVRLDHLRLRTKREKTLLLPICLRSCADKEVLREQLRHVAMDDLTSQKRHKRIVA